MSNKYLSPTDYLVTNINEQILSITLNRPDALNALRPEMLDGITKLIEYSNVERLVYIAIDGVAPKGKMKQQKMRKMRKNIFQYHKMV